LDQARKIARDIVAELRQSLRTEAGNVNPRS
jgi:hypothetical protein